MGAQSSTRVSQRCSQAPSGWRDAKPWTRRHGCRLGLPVCSRREDATLAELRSLQDWVIRYAASKAEGVAEVASVGGFVKQYSIVVDPNRLRAQGIPLNRLRDAVKSSNSDVGGRTIELSEFEFMIRGRGYLKGIADIENIVLKTDRGVPLRIGDIARVEIAPDERRGIAELNGDGEVASGIVLQRLSAMP